MRLGSVIDGEAAGGSTRVVIVDELFVESKSVSVPETVAELATCPWAVGVTTIVTNALPPEASDPKLQLTVLVPLHDPCVGVAEPNVRPPGKTSLTLTPVAFAGPLFVTVMRYESGTPT